MMLINLLCALIILHEPHADPDVCICDANRIEGGWCEKCDVGYCAGLRFTSRTLGEALDFHGHRVVAERTACPACRALIKSGGFCESCHMGFVGGRGYFSRICYQLAKSKPVGVKNEHHNAEEVATDRKECCPEDGWCDKCQRGVAGHRTYNNKRDYEATLRSIAVLKLAIETSARCESCAEAILSDSRCPICRVSYKDGKPVESERSIEATSSAKANEDAGKPFPADKAD